MATYIALLRKEKKGVYGVDFPDFPGCITARDTLEEAGKRASEALWFHIQGMLEDGEPISEPSTLDDVVANPDHADAAHFLVTVPDVKSKRINISLPETILKEIDAHAEQLGLSRSAFLVEAAKESMKKKPSKTKKRSARAKQPPSTA
jgi:predicted RNase H-like HicB family nuclease